MPVLIAGWQGVRSVLDPAVVYWCRGAPSPRLPQGRVCALGVLVGSAILSRYESILVASRTIFDFVDTRAVIQARRRGNVVVQRRGRRSTCRSTCLLVGGVGRWYGLITRCGGNENPEHEHTQRKRKRRAHAKLPS